MLPPHLEDVVRGVAFRDPASARARLEELAADSGELLALERLSPDLRVALDSSPDPDGALNNLGRYVNAAGARWPLFQFFSVHPAALETLLYVMGASQYLADVLVRNPEYFDLLAATESLKARKNPEELRRELEASCSAFRTVETRMDAVRRFRRREILRIGAADLRGLFGLEETVAELSCLADAVVVESLRIVSGAEPPCGLTVLALGKLGGEELNYSSDIDLIFVAEDEKQLEAATRVARALTRALSEVSSEGFLYRVDLLLRPYGASGPLVVSGKRFEKYFADEAHSAERQAMLKARVIAGRSEWGERLLEKISCALFKDGASARRQVRELKERIEQPMRRKGREAGHIKLSPGGIRDVEFLVQALQLEHGGAMPEVRSGNTLRALARLAGAGLVPEKEAAELREAYIFLRAAEHRLQLMNNLQVHRLPDREEDIKRLAGPLGFQSPGEAREFRGAYESKVSRVRSLFEKTLG